jgi:hypothetical protein
MLNFDVGPNQKPKLDIAAAVDGRIQRLPPRAGEEQTISPYIRSSDRNQLL